MLNFVARHFVRHDEDELVALKNADLRQAQTGVPGSGFNDGAAGCELAVLFRRLDHGPADAVLDGPARVLAFQLHEQPTEAGFETGELDHWGVADEVEGGFGRTVAGGHGTVL